METAQSLGDDTHAVGHTAKVGTRARATHRVLCPLVPVGCKPGLSIGARDKDAGQRERKTPTPCAKREEREERKKKEKKERQTERKKETKRKRTRKRKRVKEQEKEKREKEKMRKRKKKKNAVCRSCAWPCVGGSPKPPGTWTARPACTTTPGRRTRSAPRTGTLPSRKRKSGTARASSSGSRRRQHPQRNLFWATPQRPQQEPQHPQPPQFQRCPA